MKRAETVKRKCLIIKYNNQKSMQTNARLNHASIKPRKEPHDDHGRHNQDTAELLSSSTAVIRRGVTNKTLASAGGAQMLFPPHTIEALRIRIGFWGPLYYNKEPPKPYSNYSGPYSTGFSEARERGQNLFPKYRRDSGGGAAIR